MPVPQIVSIAEGLQTSDSSSWTLNYPSSEVTADRLLIFICAVNGNPNPTSVSATDWVTASGFTTGTAGGKRVVPGGGLSGTFTVTLNAAEQGAWKVLCIAPWEGTIGTNWTNSDSSGGAVPASGYTDEAGTSADPGPMSPFNWDSSAEETLFLAICGADGGGTTFSDNPDNYTVVGSNQSSGNGAAGAALSVVSRQVTAEPEDPNSWTLSASVTFRALVVAVRGGTAGAAVDAPKLHVVRSVMRW